MAIVKNKAHGQSGFVDPPLCTPNRVIAGTPNGTTVPAFSGEIVEDTTNHVRWRAIGLTNADWIPMEAEVT